MWQQEVGKVVVFFVLSIYKRWASRRIKLGDVCWGPKSLKKRYSVGVCQKRKNIYYCGEGTTLPLFFPILFGARKKKKKKKLGFRCSYRLLSSVWAAVLHQMVQKDDGREGKKGDSFSALQPFAMYVPHEKKLRIAKIQTRNCRFSVRTVGFFFLY